MTVCAVVAAWNEQDTVAAVVAGVRPHAETVIVVDDGSVDATAGRAAEAGAVVIRHDRNRGQGGAGRTGLARALASGCAHVLRIDADLQHDPSDVPRLIETAARENVDLVIAERAFALGSMPTARYYSNRIGSRILSGLLGTTLDDSQSGFRLVRASSLRPLRLTASGYEIETEMLIKLLRAGATLARLTIPARYVGSRSRLRSFRDTFRTCMLALWYRYFGCR